jgi:hypothetical protein
MNKNETIPIHIMTPAAGSGGFELDGRIAKNGTRRWASGNNIKLPLYVGTVPHFRLRRG